MELISIIVPVYNASSYIVRCLDSIRAQTYTYFEVIIVDDGSTDESGALCDNYCSIDQRFNVVHQENLGPGPARNTGLNLIKGKYVYFLDSDDAIMPEALETAYNLLKSNLYDMAILGFTQEGNNNCQSLKYDGHTEILSREEMIRRICTNNNSLSKIFNVVWNKFYSAALLRTIRFDSISVCEDMFFNYRVLPHINKCIVCWKQIVIHTMREDSMSLMPRTPAIIYRFFIAYENLIYETDKSEMVLRGKLLTWLYGQIPVIRKKLKKSDHYEPFAKTTKQLVRNTLFEFMLSKAISTKQKIVTLAMLIFHMPVK